MRSLKKILSVTAAIAVLSCSVSALAANTSEVSGVTGTYSLEQNKLNVTVPAAADVDTQMTVLVLAGEVEEGVDITESDILYINQYGTSDEDALVNMGLNLDALKENEEDDITELPVGSYPIKVGYYDEGNFTIAEGTITIEEEAIVEPPVTTVSIKWGDIDGNGSVAGSDALSVLKGTIKNYKTYTITDAEQHSITATVGSPVIVNGVTVKWGDIDGNGSVAGSDALSILKGTIKNYKTYTITDTNSNSTSVTVGTVASVAAVPVE